MTTIISNGSNWAGEEPDTIDQLIEVLKTEVIEDRFFFKKKEYWDKPENSPFQWVILCPIMKQHLLTGEREKHYTFFGNFEKVSHVFNIETDEPEVISKLKAAIMANEGWKKYIKHLRVKAN